MPVVQYRIFPSKPIIQELGTDISLITDLIDLICLAIALIYKNTDGFVWDGPLTANS